MQPMIMPRLSQQVRAEALREAAREAELRQMALTLGIIAEHVSAMQRRLAALLDRPDHPGESSPIPTPATDEEWEVMRRVLAGKTRKVEAVITMLNRKAGESRRVIREAHMR